MAYESSVMVFVLRYFFEPAQVANELATVFCLRLQRMQELSPC